MNIKTDFNRKDKTYFATRAVPMGKVYSWGSMQQSYLRVDGGSISLGTYTFLPLTHPHFGPDGPRVEIASKADLTIQYEA